MPALRSTLRAHPLATLGLVALLVIAATQRLRDAGDRVDEILHGDHYVRQPFPLDPFTLEVTSVDASAEAAGLRKGDVVLSVNGVALDGLAGYVGAVRRARFGDRLGVRIRRVTDAGPIEQDVSVPLPQFTYVGYTRGRSPAYWLVLALRIATPILCMALGFWVAAVRVYDRAAWNLLFVMLSVANLIQDGRTVWGHQDALQPLLTGFSGGLIRLGPIALAYFGITFSEPLAFDRKHPWVKWIWLGPMLLRAAFIAVLDGLVLRARGVDADVLRLDEGGTVLGLMPEGSWVQGQVQLGSGDLLVAFTDGISEEMNASDEEWGVERLTAALQSTRSATPQVILESVLASAEAFVAGAAQHDDMTLIVMAAL